MENEQFSAVFKWVFFFCLLSVETASKKQQCHWWAAREGEACTRVRGEFSKFSESERKKKISIELILNAALSAACLLPHWKVRACLPGGGGGWGSTRPSRVTTILWSFRLAPPRTDWLLRWHLRSWLSPLAPLAAALCLFGDFVSPRKRVAPAPSLPPPTRLSTASVLCLWCHNKRIMLPLVECESLPLVCQLPFVFAFLLARRTVCLAVQFSTVVV